MTSALLLTTSTAGCEEDPLPPLPPTGNTNVGSIHESSSTSPSETTAAVPSMLEPPHLGRIIPIGSRQGYVEWVVEPDDKNLRVYFLNDNSEPLRGVQDTVLFVETPQGPRRVPLRICDDDEYADACLTGALPSTGVVTAEPHADRRDAEKRFQGITGLIRFTLNNEAKRVLLGQGRQSPPPIEQNMLPSENNPRQEGFPQTQ